jgi:hypothetical protein
MSNFPLGRSGFILLNVCGVIWVGSMGTDPLKRGGRWAGVR